MNARANRSLTGAGVAAVLTAATVTTAGIHAPDVNPSLRTEFAAVQLQALAVSSAQAAAAAPAAAVTPAVIAAAAAATDPMQIVTDIVKNALGIAATALWYAAFPITLPLSVIGGLVMSVAQTINRTQVPAATNPLQGVAFFFTAPNILLTAGFANIGLAMNVIQQQQIHVPIGIAAATRSVAAAAAKRAPRVPAAPAASARSAKKVAAAADSAAKVTKRAAAVRSRDNAR